MASNRNELDQMLDALEAKLPAMIKQHPDDDFWGAFAGESELIEDAAIQDDCAHVHGRLNCMLGAQGLIPADNEGESCA